MKHTMVSGGAREEFWTGERCYITELMNDAAIPGVSLANCRVAPGTTTELHCLGVDEWQVVQAGHGVAEIGESAPFAIAPGDSIAVPAQTPQRVSNTGDTDLVFYCVCIPRFTPDCYEPLEKD